jgi:hypothetical protein
MEPSSTAFRRAVALLTIATMISLVSSASVAACGVVGMGRVQAIRVVPRVSVQSHGIHRHFQNRHFAAPNRRFIERRFHANRFGYLSLPYAPYLIDTGQPSAPTYDPGGDIGPTIMPYERAACVRPLIIQIRPAKRAASWPHVIYGRPPVC